MIEDMNSTNFIIGIFDRGDSKSCLYSYILPCCALAEARTHLDGSNFFLNCCCLQLASFRWLTRSAYGIGELDSGIEDMIVSILFPCCVINQLYQHNSRLGNPTEDSGSNFNTHEFVSENDRNCDQCCEACFLQPCLVGKIMNKTIGMPYYLGCCCMNMFAARNIFRYHYRIQPTYGGDIYDELLMPIGYCFGGLLICNPIISVSLPLALATQLLRESQIRPQAAYKRYLFGYQDEASIPTVDPDAVAISIPANGSNHELGPDQSGLVEAEIMGRTVLNENNIDCPTEPTDNLITDSSSTVAKEQATAEPALSEPVVPKPIVIRANSVVLYNESSNIFV